MLTDIATERRSPRAPFEVPDIAVHVVAVHAPASGPGEPGAN
jgi:hypothetical protein